MGTTNNFIYLDIQRKNSDYKATFQTLSSFGSRIMGDVYKNSVNSEIPIPRTWWT